MGFSQPEIVQSGVIVGTTAERPEELAGALSDREIVNAGEAIKQGKLQVVLQQFEPDPLPVNILYPAQSFMPQKIRSFVDFAVPLLRKKLPQAQSPGQTVDA
jgi:DNA-binding transcriptional LysR family regulator